MRLTILKIIYLLVALSGLIGTLKIVIATIYLTAVSNINMVLIFSLGCLSLMVIWAGFYGFYELVKMSDAQKTNVIHVAFTR